VLFPGELIWVDLDPAFGHEQAGRRPAVVVSDEAYNQLSSCIIVCPITRNSQLWPFKVSLEEAAPIEGRVLVDQVRVVDKRRVVSPSLGRVSDDLLSNIRGRLAALLGIRQSTG
jgi:mRNA interferase MazF